MKKLLICAFLGMVSGGVAAPRAQARPRPPASGARHTVLQFYNLLPSNPYFMGGNRAQYIDKKQGWVNVVVDISHDYLRSGGEAGQPQLTLAVFRFRGQELLGVSSSYEMGSDLNFYRLQSGRLRDVTRQVLPLHVPETQHAILPRVGTTIRMESGDDEHDDSGRYLYSLLWRNGRFVKTR